MTIVGQATLYFFHIFDWYPEREVALFVAKILGEPQSNISQAVQWGVAAAIGIALLVLYELWKRRADKFTNTSVANSSHVRAGIKTKPQGGWRQTRAITDEDPDGMYEWVGPAPLRDVWVFDAVCRMYFGKWEVMKFDSSSAGIGQENSDRLYDLAVKEFRQLAYDGKIPVWGKRNSQDVWRLIPPSHWRNHSLDWMRFLSALEGHPDAVMSAPAGNGSHRDVWIQLMTSKADVENALMIS